MLRKFSALPSLHHCYLRQLKSLLGKLQFVSCFFPTDCCFLRRFHNATLGSRKPNRTILLADGALQDLRLWLKFLQVFNGRGLMSYGRPPFLIRHLPLRRCLQNRLWRHTWLPFHPGIFPPARAHRHPMPETIPHLCHNPPLLLPSSWQSYPHLLRPPPPRTGHKQPLLAEPLSLGPPSPLNPTIHV